MLTENDKTIIRLGQYIAHLEHQGVQLCAKIQELERQNADLEMSVNAAPMGFSEPPQQSKK